MRIGTHAARYHQTSIRYRALPSLKLKGIKSALAVIACTLPIVLGFVVPLGVLDLGVEGGRSLVDIPVIGPFQACLHIAAQLGERFGVISYTAQSTVKGRMQARHLGMEHFIGGYADSNTKLRTMADRREDMKATFIASARKLIDEDGCDVIIPRGISQCPVHIDPVWLSDELGVPVVEGIGAPIRLAAMLAGLKLKHSRVRWPKSQSRPNMPGMPPL